MNVALLGEAPLALELSRSLSAERGERLVLATSDPAEVLARPDLDVLILGDAAPHSLAVAARIASRTSLVVVPDARQGSSFANSLVFPDEAGPAVWIPAFRARFDPRIQELAERLDHELGSLVAIRFERHGTGNGGGGGDEGSSEIQSDGNGAPLFRLAEAKRVALHDVDLLRSLLGGFRSVSAVQTSGGGAELTNLTVTFARDSETDVLWSYRRGERDQGNLTLQGARGEARIAWEGDRILSCRIGDQVLPAPAESEISRRIWEEVRIRRREIDAGEGPRWSELADDFDLVDAIGRSLRRRRTIDLSVDQRPDGGEFRPPWVSIGCAVPLLTLIGLSLLLAGGATFDPRDPEQRLAEAAGLVVHRGGEPEIAELSAGERAELERIRRRYHESSAAILVEGASPADPLDRERRDRIVRELTDAGFADAPQRVVIRPLTGRWFANLMIAAWVLLVLPLAIFVALQGVLVITRRSAGRRSSAPS